MPIREAEDYLSGPFQKVFGWCSPHLWQAIEPLHLFQASLGIRNPVAEIGVQHGKFLLGLIKTAGAPAGNFAIDIFSQQQFNLDQSGNGGRISFENNLDKTSIPRGAVEILEADSLALNADQRAEIRRKSGGFSFFSVDGGHRPEHTINDVLFAIEASVPQGIIFVDDYYNLDWPGVHEGIAKLYLLSAPRFVPLLYLCNKLFLCNLSYHGKMLEVVENHIAAHFPATIVRRKKLYGYDMLAITVDESKPLYTSLSVR